MAGTWGSWPPTEWKKAARLSPPSRHDLEEAIKTGLGETREKEIFLRTRLWWFHNHPRRKKKSETTSSPTREHTEIVLKLAGVECARSSEEHLVPAEIWQEPEATSSPTKEYVENLRELEGLLSPENPEERLVLAEIAREIGEFYKAKELFKTPFPECLEVMASTVLEFAEHGVSEVRNLSYAIRELVSLLVP